MGLGRDGRWWGLGVVVAVRLTLPAGAAEWASFLGPNGDGTSPETNLIERIPAEGLPILWETEVGTGYAAPSVREERLVLFHRLGDEEVVEARHAYDGHVLWRTGYPTDYVDPFGYNNGPRSAPVVSDRSIYTFGAEGVLQCLNLHDGSLVWRIATADAFDIPEPFFGVGSAPLLWNQRLLVMVGGQPEAGMAAFDPETGAVLWTAVGRSTWDGQPKTGWPGEPPVRWRGYEKIASYASPMGVHIHGRDLLLAFMRQGLVLLDPKDGSVLDHFWFRSRVDSSVNAANPLVVDNRILISSAYYGEGAVLLEVDEAFHLKEIWRNRSLELHWATPIHHDRYVYAFSGRDEPDARFRCVEWATGRVMWDQDERGPRRMNHPDDKYMRGSLIKADGRLIALGESGLLGFFELNPEHPVELGRWKVPGLRHPCWAGPVLSRGRLYLRSEQRLVCLDVRSRRTQAP